MKSLTESLLKNTNGFSTFVILPIAIMIDLVVAILSLIFDKNKKENK